MPIAIVIGCGPVVVVHRRRRSSPIDQDELAVAGALAGAPIRDGKGVTVDLEVPADAEIVIEGLIDHRASSSPRRRSARATAMSRSRPTTCRCR